MNTMPTVAENTKLLIQAAGRGDVVEVRRLIPISDPKLQESAALQLAVYYGHIECVALLVPVSDCTVGGSAPLWMATGRRNRECMELVFDHSDLHHVLEFLKQHGDRKGNEELYQFFENFMAERQQRILHQALDTQTGHKTLARKM